MLWSPLERSSEYYRPPSPGTLGPPHYNGNNMSVYDERREELEQQEFMMGTERGRLSVTMDLLTDALVLVGQHGVYCQSARQPGKPAMDIQMISKCLTDAKELVADVMGQLKRKSQPAS
jgi:hypothetical protein